MKSLKTLAAAAVIVLCAPLAITAHAQGTMDHGKMGSMNMPGMKMDNMAAGEMSEGEVRKVDKDNQKITLKHGAIKNLEMPAMTMVFGVKDPALLDKVQVGGKVRFTAEKAGAALVVTAIEVVQ